MAAVAQGLSLAIADFDANALQSVERGGALYSSDAQSRSFRFGADDQVSGARYRARSRAIYCAVGRVAGA